MMSSRKVRSIDLNPSRSMRVASSIRQTSRQRVVLLSLISFISATVLPTAAPGKECYRFATDLNDHGVALNTSPVCKALLRNFNQFCNEPPMVCELKIHPKFSKQLDQPIWKRISPTPSIEDIERFVKTPEQTTATTIQGFESMWPFWQPKIETAFQRGTLTLDEAKVDLLNRGYKERVFRMQTGECTSKNHATSDSDHSLMYQTEGISTNYAPEVHQRHPDRGSSSGTGGIVFNFNGRMYDYGMRLDTIVVNRSNNSTDRIIGRRTGVCAIQLIYK